jgi:hypothetical protein
MNDGHNTDINYAGNWSRTFLTPLLNDNRFVNKTLVLLTFDESETYTIKNQVWALLLGDAIPESLRGTMDNTFYTHYSSLSTVQANWGLYNLGRGDVITNYSNVFALVANATGYENAVVAPADIPFFNFTSGGYFDTANEGPIPAVNQDAPGAGGRGILPSLKGANGSAIPPPPSSGSPTATGSKSAGLRQFTYSFEGMIGCVCVIFAFSVGLVV